MVVIGRGKGEVLFDAALSEVDHDERDKQYADSYTVLWLAKSIAKTNADLMRRLE